MSLSAHWTWWDDGADGVVQCELLAPRDTALIDPLRMRMSYRTGYSTAQYAALLVPIFGAGLHGWLKRHHETELGQIDTPDVDWLSHYQAYKRLQDSRREQAEWQEKAAAKVRAAIRHNGQEEWERRWAADQAKDEWQDKLRKKAFARQAMGYDAAVNPPMRPDNLRQRRMWGMRQAGATYKVIAATFGISISNVQANCRKYEQRIIRATKAEWQPVLDEAAYDVWHTFTHKGRVTNV